ncbi:MAG TPA: DNA-3-methyladenine glycosylase [Verrucomicrobiae bacterium]|nr:DNA-3-methyladenine glycosylase [Verrucomicrobiae bacterium]
MPTFLDPQKLRDPTAGARYLLGAVIERRLDDGTILKGRIAETESYHQSDPASHTYRGPSARNAAMFGPPGHAYIYFTYGVHWCFNVTAGVEGEGAGVLIRAIEPLAGIERMREFRKGAPDAQLTNGPGKLAQALAIDKMLYGHDLRQPPLQVYDAGNVKASSITTATRIGIRLAADELLRFYITDSPYVSKK